MERGEQERKRGAGKRERKRDTARENAIVDLLKKNTRIMDITSIRYDRLLSRVGCNDLDRICE